MASDVYVKFKKGQYEKPVDDIEGLVIFDTTLNTLRLSGREYGPLSAFKPSNEITTESTNQQLATAKSVYDAIVTATAPLYNNINGGSSVVYDGGPARVPAPYVYTDNESTDVVLEVLQANSVYVFNQPLNSLVINKVIDSTLESTLYFRTGDGTIEFTVPQGVYKINSFFFEKNKSYCLSIKNKVMSCDVITPYMKTDTLIFGSSQLEGGYMDAPQVYESAESNPVINNVQPNAVYKFGVCESITLNNIPSNSLETVVYWTSENNTTLYLSGDENTTLKISGGSMTTYRNAMYVMAIKDGVIIINKIAGIS